MRIHEMLSRKVYYYFGTMIGVYLILGLFSPTQATYLWLIPNIVFSMILVFLMALSRFADDRYETLFKKFPEYQKGGSNYGQE